MPSEIPLPTTPNLELHELAADFVTVFDSYRSPTSDMDLARGDIGRLNGRQFANLMAWGHPHVLDQFRFHMTLTGPIDELERDYVAQMLRRHFGSVAEEPLCISQVALFVEPEPNAPFLIDSIHFILGDCFSCVASAENFIRSSVEDPPFGR